MEGNQEKLNLRQLPPTIKLKKNRMRQGEYNLKRGLSVFTEE